MHVVQKISSLLNISPQEKSNLSIEFFPLPFDKYITIYNELSVPSNSYDYFNDVIDDISGFLEKNNIYVIQLLNSQSDSKIKNCFYIDKFSYSQLNYIIKNSLLHICTDAYTNEIAGIYNKKIISLLGNRFPKSSKSWYSEEKNSNIFFEHALKKPTFSLQEFPKSINLIKTENISKKILNFLGSNINIKYNTLFIGSKYHEKSECDYIPNFILNDDLYSKFNLNIRLDKFYNEENCINFCSRYEHILYLNRPISENFIKIIKNNCKKIIYYVDENTIFENITNLINYGIKVELFYNGNLYNKNTAFKFLDISKINIFKNEIDNKKFEEYSSKYFKTSKLIISNNKKYASYAHLEKGIELSKINKCINDALFWQDDCRYKIIGD